MAKSDPHKIFADDVEVNNETDVIRKVTEALGDLSSRYSLGRVLGYVGAACGFEATIDF